MAEPAGLWRPRRAREVRFRDRLLLSVLGGLGAISVIRLVDWWFRPAHVGQPVLFVALSLAFWYAITRIVLGWVNYAAITRPADRSAPSGLSVAIFTTSSPGEPLGMFEKTLAACTRVRYPHRTYLLDDTGDPRFREVAARHGTIWLDLPGIPGAKAGKINRALELTTEEYILVLDPDHLPFAGILDRVLGHFDDPGVGYVQVAQAYYNQERSFTARGAAEQTYAFYGPGQMGLQGHGAAVAIGANCTFRRKALASIGGHGVGLAEDLVTAIRIHAAGWRSVYLPEIVSRGLVPEDLGSFYRQQLKWSRGVYEVVFAELPRLFGKLRWRQRLSYLAIGTYYGFGITMPLFLLFPYLYLWAGIQPAAMRFGEFVIHALPVGVVGLAIYFYVQRFLADPATERRIHWRGATLKLACWPVFLAGTVLAIVRAEIPYIPTAKEAVRGRFFRLAWPQLLQIGIFVVTLGWVLYRRLWRMTEGTLALSSEATWGMVFFAALPVLLSGGALYAAWQARRPAAGAPWGRVDPDSLGTAS
jgi:cellulose synthase (UDP-forming)